MAERLQKVLAHAGVSSRRAAERLILAGRVRVNGTAVTVLGTSVDPMVDDVVVDGESIQPARRGHAYLMLHKPAGVVSTMHDPEGRFTVVDLVRTPRRLYPVGRLDADSEGLLLLTDDGELTMRLTHARYGVEKEYQALVRGTVSLEQLRALRRGVELEDGPARAVRAEWLEQDAAGTWVSVVLHEGRKRQVRRMLWEVECPVTRLVRVRIGPVTLGDLPAGQYRPLRRGEVARLRQAVGLGRS